MPRNRTHFILSSVFINILILSLINSIKARPKTQPLSYSFSLNNLQIFYPGSRLSQIQTEYGRGELIQDLGKTKIYKFSFTKSQYPFPIFVQINSDGKATDFLVRLPSYFSHDLFHQNLIKRMGKQSMHRKKHRSAIYVWNNWKGNKFYYQASCTLSCFPVYFAGLTATFSQHSSPSPILKHLTVTYPNKYYKINN